jgi:tRNA threonylcarbamoyladenosine modification (KEOPS) complex  Pcc1 subunit
MDKKTILAFLLIAGILFFWNDYLRWIGYAPKTADKDSSAVSAASDSAGLKAAADSSLGLLRRHQHES